MFLQVLVQPPGARARNARAQSRLTALRLRRPVQAVPRGNLLCEVLRDTLTLRLRTDHHHNGEAPPEVPRSRRKLQRSKVAVHRFLKNVFRYGVVLTAKAMYLELDGHQLSKDQNVSDLRQKGLYQGNQRRKLQAHLRRKLLDHPQRELQDLFPHLLWNHLLRRLICHRGPLNIGRVCRLIDRCR